MSNTRKSIIKIADELIRSRGYNAFSYTDISKRLGVKNAAIHYHFPTKLDLALAVVQYHTQNFNHFQQRNATKPPLQRLKLFLSFYTAIQTSGKICIIGALTTDWNSLNDATQKALKEFTQAVRTWVTNTLQQGKDNGTLSFKSTADSEALSIITNIFAATQLARVTGSNDFASVKKSILNRITL